MLVDLVGEHPQPVAGADVLQPRRVLVGGQELADLGHTHMESVPGALGIEIRPQLVDDPLGAHPVARVEHEQSQQSALLRRRRRHIHPVDDDLERAKHSKRHPHYCAV